MTNHIHFMISPLDEAGVSNTLKVVGSRYAQYFNRKYRRTGMLWEGRHRSSLIDSSRYFLTCLIYIELNPVRAGMVDRPDDYEWSSFRNNALGKPSWLKIHDEYRNLGSDTETLQTNYRKLVAQSVSADDVMTIRRAAHYCLPMGDQNFQRLIEKKYGLKPAYANRGRPSGKVPNL